MSERIWHKGPPPHVGWWNASIDRSPYMWRWWNGMFWSIAIVSRASSVEVVRAAVSTGFTEPKDVEWTSYYPKNARVPRIDPRSTK